MLHETAKPFGRVRNQDAIWVLIGRGPADDRVMKADTRLHFWLLDANVIVVSNIAASQTASKPRSTCFCRIERLIALQPEQL